ncbi:MAG: class D sortase [Patescibacteria group bacterium]
MDNKEKSTGVKLKVLKIAIIVIILVGFGILAYPWLPALKYKISQPEAFYPYETKLLNSNLNLGKLPEVKDVKRIPSDNRLVIPKIGVDVSIVEGKNEEASLLKGAWHIPGTQDPAKGGNMVISGHRFRYRPPNNTTFYLLDKLAVGDPFIVYWQGKEYDYQVSQTKIVEPNAIEILDNTDSPQVTLYTCTPLFTTKQRLVVIGELII